MVILLTVLHVLICLFLIGIVLLQRGKGADLGATFGGSSQTLFGSRGAATFLNKLTTVAAILFMFTSLFLTMATTKSSSVVETAPVQPTAQEQKALPGQLPPQPAQQPTEAPKDK